MNIFEGLSLFSLCLGVGYFSLLQCIPTRPISGWFFRTQALIASLFLGFSLGLYLWLGNFGFPLFLQGVVAVIFFLYAVFMYGEMDKWGRRVAVLGLVGSVALLWIRAHSVLFFGYLCLTALLSSSVLLTMRFGHYYLTNWRLSFRPLRIMNMIFLLGIIGKSLWIGCYLAILQNRGLLPKSLISPMGYGVFLGQRLLFGLASPLVLAILVDRTIALKNNQSATGILYAATILVMIGELSGLILYFLTNVPV